jgi:hypothetical protein
MTQLEQLVVDTLRTLPLEKQQEVLDFVEFLKARFSSASVVTAETTDPVLEEDRSFAEVAQKYIGCVEGGPEDLSTNPKYMEGFGQ